MRAVISSSCVDVDGVFQPSIIILVSCNREKEILIVVPARQHFLARRP